MVSKISIVFLVGFLLFQFSSMETDASVVRRDVQEPPKDNTLEDTFNSFKKSIDDLMQEIKNSEVVQTANKAIEEIGNKVKTEGQALVEKWKKEEKPAN